MKALYISSRYIAAAIVGSLVLSAGAAFAVTRDSNGGVSFSSSTAQSHNLGRIVVTPTSAKYERPPENIGRFVISRHGAKYVPALGADNA